jgi:hypothetical protein
MPNIVVTAQLFSWADKGTVSQQRQRQCADAARLGPRKQAGFPII